MATPEFRPTHVVPPDGLPAWESADVSRPTQPLDPLLPVELTDRRGDWGRIVCANGWSAWVDGRLLVSVPHGPPEPGKPMARTADPRPLMARVQEAAGQYRRAADELAEERIDGETFRRRTQGLRVGMVVDGEAVWLYDAEHERWVYCDGIHLSTYAAGAGPGRPSAATPTPPEPTSVAAPAQTAGSGEAETPPTPDPARHTAPPEPTRIVDPAQMAAYSPAEKEVRPSPYAAGASPDRPNAATPARDAPPAPTRVVTPAETADPGQPDIDAGTPPARSAAPPQATRVVDPAQAADPDRTPNDTGTPTTHEPAPDTTPPQATQLVDPAQAEGGGPADTARPAEGGGPVGGSGPSSAPDAGAEPTRVVDPGQPAGGRPAAEDGELTQVMEPVGDDDARSPRAPGGSRRPPGR